MLRQRWAAKYIRSSVPTCFGAESGWPASDRVSSGAHMISKGSSKTPKMLENVAQGVQVAQGPFMYPPRLLVAYAKQTPSPGLGVSSTGRAVYRLNSIGQAVAGKLSKHLMIPRIGRIVMPSPPLAYHFRENEYWGSRTCRT